MARSSDQPTFFVTTKRPFVLRILCAAVLSWLCVGGTALAGEPAADIKGSHDHPRVSRFKGSTIRSYRATDFGQAALLLSVPSKHQVRNVEGKLTNIVYDIPPGHESHEVYRSYKTELERAGFTILFSCAGEQECGGFDLPLYFQSSVGFQGNVRADSVRYLAAQRHAPEGDTYVSLYAYFQAPAENRAILTVVDAAPLSAGMVTVSADALARDITNDGRAIVPGVFFDTDRDTLKAESDAALKEMATLLNAHPALKVFIVGHTDNAGQPGRNLELSQSRAASVAKALTSRYHIDGKRLEAKGVGPLAPVASNRTEAGRARNRRVELVER